MTWRVRGCSRPPRLGQAPLKGKKRNAGRGNPLDKTVVAATGMKKIVCTCGFTVMSHDHKEVAYFAVAHVRDAHKQEITLDDAKGLMKDA